MINKNGKETGKIIEIRKRDKKITRYIDKKQNNIEKWRKNC